MFRGLLLAVLLAPLPLHAEEPPVIRNTVLGFNHQFPNRRWVPLRVDIDNPGPARHAVITIDPITRSQGQSIGITKPVWLPANARSSFFLTIFPDVSELPPPTKPGHEKREPSNIVKTFTAKLTDGGLKVFSQQDVMGKILSDNASIMLVADARLTSYRIPADLPTGWTRKPAYRVGLDPRDLPARAVDYDAISLLVLGDLGPREPHAMQRQAILDWVRAGGTLFVPATEHFPDFLAPLLPVDFAAPDKLATEPRLSRWGKPTIFNNGLILRRQTMRDGTILAGDIHSPLLAQRREGLGTIITCSLDTGDLAFQHWSGATNFNAELLGIALKTIPAADRLLERSPGTDAIVSSLAGIKVLGRGPMLGYLVTLVAGIVVVLYAFRLTHAPERGWTIAAILAIVTGAVVIVVADKWKGQPEPFLNEVNVVYAAGEHAVAHSALGLYSPRAASFDLAASAETLRLRPRKAVDPFSLRVNDDLRIPGLAVRANDMRALFGQATLPDTKLPQARARLTAAGLELTVTTPQSLEDCFYKCNRFVAPIGDLPAGATKTFRNLQTSDTFSSRVVQNAGDELRTRLRRLFFPDPVYTLGKQRPTDTTAFRERGPAVYGWTDTSLFPVTVQQKIARRAINFWNIDSPITYAGQKLTLPRGLPTLRLKNKDARTVERAEGRFSGTRGCTLLAEFSLPADCPDLQITSAKVFVNYRGSAFRCRISLQPPGTDELKLKRQPELTGEIVPDPGQWYDPVRRSFLVAVEIEPVTLEQAAVNYWQIRELDMEIGGTTP